MPQTSEGRSERMEVRPREKAKGRDIDCRSSEGRGVAWHDGARDSVFEMTKEDEQAVEWRIDMAGGSLYLVMFLQD